MAEITVLRVVDEGATAAKTIKLNPCWDVEKEFKRAKWFHYSTKTVEGIKQLSAFLTQAASDKHSLLIRGVLALHKDPHQPVRRLGVKGHGENGFFLSHPQGQPWLLLDFDGIPCPNSIDFLKHPKLGIEYLVSLLPSYFHGVSYHYHLSSGAGLDGGKTIRAHILYWLDKPVHDDVLRAWAKGINCHGPLIDTQLFGAVQPHYTADPIFDGVPDPFFEKRSGFVKAKSDTVTLPKLVPPGYASVGIASGLNPSEAFSTYLNAVGGQCNFFSVKIFRRVHWGGGLSLSG